MRLRDFAARLAREPLLHFLLAGLVVFAVLSGRPPDPGERRIAVNEAIVSRLVERWTQSFRRAPTDEEVDSLIRDYVSDQVYYREGLRLGLDRDDEVVIRRMRVKLLAMASADAESSDPTDAELQQWIDANPQRYAAEPRIDLEQIYLGQDSGKQRARARTLLSLLDEGKRPSEPLPPAPIARNFQNTVPSQLADLFGGPFADSVRDQAVGEWRGPVESGLGLHLVRITARVAPKPPQLEDIRQRVENDWRSAAISRAEERSFNELLQRYDVVIERAE